MTSRELAGRVIPVGFPARPRTKYDRFLPIMKPLKPFSSDRLVRQDHSYAVSLVFDRDGPNGIGYRMKSCIFRQSPGRSPRETGKVAGGSSRDTVIEMCVLLHCVSCRLGPIRLTMYSIISEQQKGQSVKILYERPVSK